MTVRCQDILERIDDWLDDLLDANERADIEAHLRECDSCRAEFARHESIAEDLLTLGAAASRLAGATGGTAPKKRWRHPVLAIAASVVIAIGLSAALVRNRQDPRSMSLVQAPDESRSRSSRGRPSGASRVPMPERDWTLELPPGDGRLAVPLASGNPRIRIVWLYETIGPPRNSGGDEPTTSNPSN